jgi:hypothetical protein
VIVFENGSIGAMLTAMNSSSTRPSLAPMPFLLVGDSKSIEGKLSLHEDRIQFIAHKKIVLDIPVAEIKKVRFTFLSLRMIIKTSDKTYRLLPDAPKKYSSLATVFDFMGLPDSYPMDNRITNRRVENAMRTNWYTAFTQLSVPVNRPRRERYWLIESLLYLAVIVAASLMILAIVGIVLTITG